MNKWILKIEKWKVNYEYTPRDRTIPGNKKKKNQSHGNPDRHRAGANPKQKTQK